MSVRFVAPPMPLAGLDQRFSRADLVFHGLDHSGPSYEVRVFFGRPDATTDTPRRASEGYVTSFYLFGHGGCAGQQGHCEVPESRRPFDVRPAHQLTPATRWVTVTEAVRRAMASGDEVAVTAVLVPVSARGRGDDGLTVPERVSLVTYD